MTKKSQDFILAHDATTGRALEHVFLRIPIVVFLFLVNAIIICSVIHLIAVISTRKAKVVRSLRQCAPQPKNFFMYA